MIRRISEKQKIRVSLSQPPSKTTVGKYDEGDIVETFISYPLKDTVTRDDFAIGTW